MQVPVLVLHVQLHVPQAVRIPVLLPLGTSADLPYMFLQLLRKPPIPVPIPPDSQRHRLDLADAKRESSGSVVSHASTLRLVLLRAWPWVLASHIS